jgi:hypothetical protein
LPGDHGVKELLFETLFLKIVFLEETGSFKESKILFFL